MDTPKLTAISLFSGAAGLDLGIELAGVPIRTLVYVEREAYACEVLASRMEAGDLAPAALWTDVTTFDGAPFRGLVDCITGGFPCQDISVAGKQEGIGGKRSGLWKHFARIIGEVRPQLVFIENVAALRSKGLEVVLADLAALGYDAEWGTLRASDVGATHHRDRFFLVARLADASSDGRRQGRPEHELEGSASAGSASGQALADDDDARLRGERRGGVLDGERATLGDDADRQGRETLADDDARCEGHGSAHGVRAEQPWAAGYYPPPPDELEAWREVIRKDPSLEPALCRVADGMAHRVDRLRLTGNGVVPSQAACAYAQLLRRLKG